MNFLSLFTPVNLKEEKEKFFSSSTYNPVFEYNHNQKELEEYVGKHPSKVNFVNAIISQNPKQIVTESSKYFETTITEATKTSAENILKVGYKTLNEPSNVSDLILKQLQDVINYFEIDYKVEIVDRDGFNVRPSHKNKKILISKSTTQGLFSIDSTIKHEITHIIRAINQSSNSISKSKSYLPTEEGLASYTGDYYALDGNNSKFHHAAEYLVTEVGLNGSLRDIYKYFINLKYPKEFAWQRSARHKFGFTDTSILGDIMKPAMYFNFENKISELNTAEVLKLFSGKISFDDAMNLSKYIGIVSEEKIIKYFNLLV